MSASEDRLSRALGASRAPARDAAFVLAVMERAERERYRRVSVLGAFRMAGLAAVGAGALLAVAGWGAANPDLFDSLLLSLAGAAALGLAPRLFARTQPAPR